MANVFQTPSIRRKSHRTSVIPPHVSDYDQPARRQSYSPTSPLGNSNQLSPFHSTPTPVSTPPSAGATLPFDWEAARGERPPPYANLTPVRKKPASGANSVRPKAIVRKPGIMKRVSTLPSEIINDLSFWPATVSLPASKSTGRVLGFTFHFIHMLVTWHNRRKTVSEDETWTVEEEEDRGWTVLVVLLLLTASILNALYLITRTRTYHLLLRTDPVQSPNASFVPSGIQSHREPPALSIRILRFLGRSMRIIWNFAWGKSLTTQDESSDSLGAKVQQLDVWTPGDTEMALFTIYSPAHALLWMIFSASNWLVISFLMGVVGFQIHVLILSYEALLKDRAIIAGEVMHEYDEKFVNPRLSYMKKDASVMTNEAEVVDWRKA